MWTDQTQNLSVWASEIEKAASPEISFVEIKWNRKRENNLQKKYRKRLRSSLKKQKKSAKELKMEASKTYKIETLWQRHCDLSISFEAISLAEPAEISESQPSEFKNSVCSLSKISHGSALFLSKQQMQRN